MRPLFHSFGMFLRQISRDSMLYAVCIAPLLTAFLFRFGVPNMEALLCAYLDIPSVLAGYYLLFDLFLALLTPFLFCFASSMVILTEYDENMSRLPGGHPCRQERLPDLPVYFSCGDILLVSILLLSLFSLTPWTFFYMIMTCFLASILSIAISLLIVSLSHNRVEGMAVSKLSGIMMLGLRFLFSFSRESSISFRSAFFLDRQALPRQKYPFLAACPIDFFALDPLLYRRYEKKLL